MNHIVHAVLLVSCKKLRYSNFKHASLQHIEFSKKWGCPVGKKKTVIFAASQKKSDVLREREDRQSGQKYSFKHTALLISLKSREDLCCISLISNFYYQGKSWNVHLLDSFVFYLGTHHNDFEIKKPRCDWGVDFQHQFKGFDKSIAFFNIPSFYSSFHLFRVHRRLESGHLLVSAFNIFNLRSFNCFYFILLNSSIKQNSTIDT